MQQIPALSMTPPTFVSMPPYAPPGGVPGIGSEGTGGTPWQHDLEEDLAECIAVWQESGHSRTPEFPRMQPPRSPLARGSRSHSGHYADKQTSEELPCCDFGNLSSLESLGPVISLNVGGVGYTATASTLRKAPFFDTMLRHVEEGKLTGAVDDSGKFFIDRSGELFGYVLEFLRSGHWLLRDRASDTEFVEALRDEAVFYGLHSRGRMPLPRISEYATVWQFRDDISPYVDCLEGTIREDPDHQGLFRLCKYSGGLPLDQQTCTKRFKCTSHSAQSVIAYFAMRGFSLQHVMEGSMISHTTSADGQSRCGHGTQYILSKLTVFPALHQSWTPPNTHRG